MPAIPLTVQEAFSGVFGYCSLICWILLVLPQFVTNYHAQSAEAVSLEFLTIWQIGHVASLIGALWADLISSIILIESYFCIANGILIGQCLHYNRINSRRFGDIHAASPQFVNPPTDENDRVSEPLLQHKTRHTDSKQNTRLYSQYAVVTLGVMGLGVAGWAISYRVGIWKPSLLHKNLDKQQLAVAAQVLGYLCAATFLSARIPQMIKNAKKKSCQGLSIPFFILAFFGNLTYALSILCHSIEQRYVIKNIPWLIGSLGTMGQDVFILAQFYKYRPKDELVGVDS